MLGILLILAALATQAGVPPAAAQEQPPIVIDVRAGYGGAYRIGEWFPVSVDVANAGADVSGMLEWNFPGEIEEQVFRQVIELPRGSQKRVTMSVFASRFARNGQVRLLRDDTVLVSQDISLDAIDEGVFLAAVVSGDPALLNSLSTIQIGSFTGVQVKHLDLGWLPDHVAALRGLNALFLHDVDSLALRPAQRAAIALWVSLGGHLVVSGGINGRRTAAGLADLLPVQVSDALVAGDLTPLARLAGASAPVRTPSAPLSQVQPQPGATPLPSSAGLLYHWRYGAGLTTLSAFDFGTLSGWAGEPQLWSYVLAHQVALPAGPGARLSRINLLDRGVLHLRSLDLPSTSTLLIFLLGYIAVIGPLNYLVLRRLRRLEWAWLSVPLIVVAFACGLYIVGSVLRGGRVEFNQAAVVQGVEGQPRAAATAFVGLFSPRRAAYTVGFPSDTLVNSAEGRTSLSDRFDTVVSDASGAHSIDVLADVGSIDTFVAHTALDLPLAIQSTIISDSAGLRGEVRNTGPAALEDALIVSGDSFAKLGTLAPGASQQFQSAGLQRNFPQSVILPDVGVFDRQKMLNMLFERDTVRSSPGAATRATIDNDGVYLLAWSKQPAIAASLDQQPADQNGVTLYVVRLRSG